MFVKWDETDLIEFFGVTGILNDEISESFEVSRDGLRLLVTLFRFEGTVYVSVFRDGLPKPIFTMRAEYCTHIHITKDSAFRKCFEAGVTRHPVTNMGVAPILISGVRVYMDPHFQVELIGKTSRDP